MGLKDLHIPTTTIDVPGGSFAVRGLSLKDITCLVSEHGPAAALVFGKVVNGDRIELTDVKSFISSVMPQAPSLIAAAIALAAEEYDEEGIRQAGRLTFQKQIEALEAIFHNTFASEAELKKFVESIVKLLAGATQAVQQMRLPLSELGYGVSEDGSVFSVPTGTPMPDVTPPE